MPHGWQSGKKASDSIYKTYPKGKTLGVGLVLSRIMRKKDCSLSRMRSASQRGVLFMLPASIPAQIDAVYVDIRIFAAL